MKHYLLYAHGGAYNHGSEASVKCDIALLRKLSPGCKITLSSHFPEQDIQYGLDADEIIGRNMSGKTNEEIYRETIDKITSETVCLSVGGDVYCYPNWQRYATVHNAAIEKGAKSILWSCSLEPKMFDEEMLSAFRTHDAIVVRESVSADALEAQGLRNIIRMPDVAFLLEPEKTVLPEEKYVVMNLSPLVIRKNPEVLKAYQQLASEVVRNTEYTIALVPHVEVSVDNDYEALAMLEIPEQRVFRVPVGLSAAELKYIIGNAEFCIASRTHATIAAWSSCVPTIAVGYSTKACGITKDLGQEKYLIDINEIDGNLLWKSFRSLTEDREIIREALRQKVPECVRRVYSVAEEMFGEM